jgi:hypothetical protein
MRDDMNEQDELPPELASTHQALNELASAWAATTPSAERLTAFTRQLPAQQAIAERPGARHTEAPLRHSDHTPREARTSAGERHRPHSGRVLAGVAAAIIIVGLLAATLLRLAPGRTGQITRKQATASAVATIQAARQTEEPSQQPPNGRWSTVAHTALYPAPSDGSVVYRADGAVASVSHDGGATWRALTLPSFTQKSVLSDAVYLRVSEADANVILLSMVLTVDSYDPAACPPDSRPPAPNTGIGMHGGVLASGQPYCYANFASHDGGATWTAMQLPGDVDAPPNALDMAHIWQLGQSLYGVTMPLIFPSMLGSSVLVSHDLGVTWAYDNTNSPEATSNLCSFLPSAADDALYALTTINGCPDGLSGARHYTLWRSVDGAATWKQVSTFASDAFMALVAATPSADGHGVWLYAERQAARRPDTAWVSVDGGKTWTQAPALPQTGANTYSGAARSALADGSMVVATVRLHTTSASSPPAAVSFYAWRPGDTSWRSLTTLLTNLSSSSNNEQVTLARGGSGALDTLWVVDIFEHDNPQQNTTYRYGIR